MPLRRRTARPVAVACLLLALPLVTIAAEGPRPLPLSPDAQIRELTQAASRGDAEAVRSALDRGAPIDGVDSLGLRGTALEKASAGGHVAVVELLLLRNATVRSGSRTGLYAAHGAGVGGHTEVLRILVAHAAPDDLDFALSSALVAAASMGHAATVAYLLDLGVHVDAIPARPQMPTALEAATERGHLELAAFLLDRGARVRVIEGRGVPAAEGVAALGDVPLLRRIAEAVETREEPRILYGPALAHASRAGQVPGVVLLLELGADPDFSGSRGLLFYSSSGQRVGAAPLPPLSFAAEQAHWAVVEVLLAAGADPERGELLHYAASWGNTTLVRRLLDDGVDLQAEGRFGNALTTLVYEPRGPRSDVEATAVLLMEEGIDPNVPYYGRRPINWALEREDTELVRLLEDGGASTGTTFSHKLRQVRKTLGGAAIAVLLLLGGSM
jgi:ankyrin repeat protein